MNRFAVITSSPTKRKGKRAETGGRRPGLSRRGRGAVAPVDFRVPSTLVGADVDRVVAVAAEELRIRAGCNRDRVVAGVAEDVDAGIHERDRVVAFAAAELVACLASHPECVDRVVAGAAVDLLALRGHDRDVVVAGAGVDDAIAVRQLDVHDVVPGAGVERHVLPEVRDERAVVVRRQRPRLRCIIITTIIIAHEAALNAHALGRVAQVLPPFGDGDRRALRAVLYTRAVEGVGRLRAIVDGLAVAEAAGAADEEHEREHAEGSAGGRHRVAATARELAARGQISLPNFAAKFRGSIGTAGNGVRPHLAHVSISA